jgi:hypothetical protein
MSRLFPPVGEGGLTWESKGRRSIEYLTVNGPVQIRRKVYWNRAQGSVTPADGWLGMSEGRYSVGVRELCCREAADSDFRTAAEDLACVGQIRISHETVRQIVEAEGRKARDQQKSGALGPDWTVEDCRCAPKEPTSILTGADGVMVPMVTEAEKNKRRKKRARRRKGQPKRRAMHKGSDLAYKEFKITAFYDPSKEHQYAVGLSGPPTKLGELIRRIARQLHLDEADIKYCVSDGALWIRGLYRIQLPMLDAHILDYYHLRDQVIAAGQAVYGQGTAESLRWRKEICGCLLEEGPEPALARIAALHKTLRSPGKRKALASLRQFIATRKEMLQYPEFRAAGYEIGSGPTEAFCKTLTSRLKGQGMRWDKPNAEAMMALASVRSSGLWQNYWDTRRKIPAQPHET